MQDPLSKNPLERASFAESTWKDSGKIKKAEIDWRTDQIKQIKIEERPAKHRNNRNDLLNIRRNHEARVRVQITRKNMVVKDLKPVDLAQQSKDRRREETDDSEGKRKIS